MTIAAAVLSGRSVGLYDKQGKRIGQIVLHAKDRIHGYTETTVSIRSGSHVLVYDEHAKLLFTVYRGAAAGGATTQDDWLTPT